MPMLPFPFDASRYAADIVTGPQRPSLSAQISDGLEWPPGFTGAIARYFFDSSVRPVAEVAIVGALGLLSGICGKAWNTPGKRTGLNQYIILVARSATGKEAMHTGPAKLIKAATDTPQLQEANRFIDYRAFASGQSLVKACAENPSFVNICGEFGQKLKQIAISTNRPDSPIQGLRAIMTNLYSKSGADDVAAGIAYSDKEKSVNSVLGVAYSLIGETTPSTFYELITPEMMADGLMSRFTVVEYEGERPPANHFAETFSVPWPELLMHFRGLLAQSLLLLGMNQTQQVACSPDAETMLRAFDLECDAKIKQAGDDESFRQMWNRAHLKALKIASIMAVADNCITPTMTTDQAGWAIGFIRRDIDVFTKRLHCGDIGINDHSREAKVIAIAREYLLADALTGSAAGFEQLRRNAIIPRRYFQMRTQKIAAFANYPYGATKALDETIRSLIDSGMLNEVDKLKLINEYSFSGKAFRLLSAGDFSIQKKPHWMEEFLSKMKPK